MKILKAKSTFFFAMLASAMTLGSLQFTSTAAAFYKIFDQVDYSENRKSLSSFNKIYIAPIKTDLPETQRIHSRFKNRIDRGVSERDQQEQAENLRKTLARSLGKKYELVGEEGPSILTLETTITRLESTRPTFQDLSSRPNLSLGSLYSGGAAVTINFRENGSTLAVISDDYQSNFGDGSPRTGIWSDANLAFNLWARQVSRFIKNN